MANVIRTQNIIDTNKRSLIKIVVNSDSTQEANTVIIDASTLRFALNTNGQIMVNGANAKSTYRTTIKRIAGMSSTTAAHSKLQWEGDANSEIITFGSGSFDLTFDSFGDGAVISNPEANATGAILLSTAGLKNNEGFTLFIDLRKDARDYDSGQTADRVAFNT